jgi:hypothetical protein
MSPPTASASPLDKVARIEQQQLDLGTRNPRQYALLYSVIAFDSCKVRDKQSRQSRTFPAQSVANSKGHQNDPGWDR